MIYSMNTLRISLLLSALFLLSFLSQNFATFQFVLDGTPRSLSQLNNYLQTSDTERSSSSVPCVNFIDCTVSGFGNTFCNKLLPLNFLPTQNTISMEVTSSPATVTTLATYSTFDTIFSPKYSGTQVAEFCKAFSKSTNCILLSDEDIDDVMIAYDQVFRRLFETSENYQPKSVGFIIGCKDKSSDKLNEDEFKSKIVNYLVDNEIILQGQESLVKIISLPIGTATTEEDMESVITSFKSLIKDSVVPYADLSRTLIDSWTTATLNPLKPLLSNAEKRSLLQIESAYTSGLVYIEGIVSEWQSRVGSGKLVANFGKRVEELLTTVQNRYRDRTLGATVGRERADKAKMLLDSIQFAADTLFRQQFVILQSAVIANFRKSLLHLIKGDQDISSDKGQQLLRQAEFDFQTKVANLEVPKLGLTADIIKSDLRNTLQTIITDFPESSIAKLEAIKKIESKAKKPSSSSKQGRAINVALSIVGMFRPPGYGNIQGYGNYATAFAGIPIDFLFGIQNDGDSPEIVGEDREYPLLRLQPKFNFEIDL